MTNTLLKFGRHGQIGLFYLLASLTIAPTFWYGNACGHDTATHFWRAVMVGENTAVGQPFLNWGQHFLHGYGYPIFLFYAPAFNWLITLLHQIGLDYSPAMRLLTWAAFPLAGWGAYYLGRRYLPPLPALITGLAYLFAPYLLYDGIQRGAVPELLGLALLPWVLALFDRATVKPTRHNIALAALSLAALMLTHNIIPMFAIACGLGLGLARWVETRTAEAVTTSKKTAKAVTTSASGLVVPLFVVVLGLALSAFFWLPALVELDYAQARRLASPFDEWPRWHRHFVPLSELVGWPSEPADFDLSNPATSIKLGWPQVILSLVGLLSLLLPQKLIGRWSGRAVPRLPLLMWGLIGLVSLFLAHEAAGWVWGWLPLPSLVQLPNRFMGPLSLSTAVLTGLALHQLLPPKIHPPTAVGLGLLIALAGFPWLYPLYCPLPDHPTTADLAHATQWDATGYVSIWGGEALGEGLPRWVDALPPPNPHLAAYEAGAPIQRLILPPTARLLAWQTAAHGDQYNIQLEEPATLTYGAFYLPHWQLHIGGERQTLRPASETGLMQFDLPAGRHELSLLFRPTPLRYGAGLLSWLVLLGLTGWVWRPRPWTSPLPSPPPELNWRLIALFLLLLAGLKTAVDTTNTPLRADRFLEQAGQLLMVDQPTQLNFGDQFQHLGYNAPASLPADGVLSMTQYWSPLTLPGVPFGFAVRVADEAGQVWSLPPTRPWDYVEIPGVRGWEMGRYMRDAYEVRLLPGTPPGAYWLETSAFRRDTPFALTVRNGATAPDPAWARLGQIRVTEPRQAGEMVAENTAVVQTFAPHPLNPHLTLLGHTLTDTFGRPADPLRLSLLWQHQPPNPTNEIWLELSDVADGRVYLRHAHPITPWTTTETILLRDQLTLQLPRDLPSGQYELRLEGHPLGQIRVEAPERQFSPPPTATLLPASELDFARLHRYTLTPSQPARGEPFSVELVWEALETTADNYRVFVHLRDVATGEVVQQSDAEPAGWSRPTRGWLAGEYILDAHPFSLRSDLPAGNYQLVAGLYDPLTGNRLGEFPLTEFALAGTD